MNDSICIPRISSLNFTWSRWRAGSVSDFNLPCREKILISNARVLRKHAVGYCKGESLMCRPKHDIAIMFFLNDRHFWFHLRKKEFKEIFRCV